MYDADILTQKFSKLPGISGLVPGKREVRWARRASCGRKLWGCTQIAKFEHDARLRVQESSLSDEFGIPGPFQTPVAVEENIFTTSCRGALPDV